MKYPMGNYPRKWWKLGPLGIARKIAEEELHLLFRRTKPKRKSRRGVGT